MILSQIIPDIRFFFESIAETALENNLRKFTYTPRNGAADEAYKKTQLQELKAKLDSIQESFFGNGFSGLICRFWAYCIGFTKKFNYLIECIKSVAKADPLAVNWFITVKKNNSKFKYKNLTEIYLHGRTNHLSVIDNLAQMGTPNDVLKKQIEAFISYQKADGISTPKISWKDAPNLFRREVDNYADFQHPLVKINRSKDLHDQEARVARKLYDQARKKQVQKKELFSEISEISRSENTILHYGTKKVSIQKMLRKYKNNLLKRKVQKIMTKMCLDTNARKISIRHTNLLNLLFGFNLDHPQISTYHSAKWEGERQILKDFGCHDLLQITPGKKHITKTTKGYLLERRYKYVLYLKDENQILIPFVTRIITQKINAFFKKNKKTPNFEFRLKETIHKNREEPLFLYTQVN